MEYSAVARWATLATHFVTSGPSTPGLVQKPSADTAELNYAEQDDSSLSQSVHREEDSQGSEDLVLSVTMPLPT